jgi:magnesium transporter
MNPTTLAMRAARSGKARDFATRTEPLDHPEDIRGHPEAEDTTVRMYGYGPEGVAEQDLMNPENIPSFRSRHSVVWVDVAGLRNTSLVSTLGRLFGLHPLALEDVVHTHQRTKVENYGDYSFIVVRMAPFHEEEPEQLSLFLGPDWLVTFQERAGDHLGSVRDRLRSGRGRLHSLGPDHLSYTILDAVVDGYFPVLERLGEELEDLEDEVVIRPRREMLSRVHVLRRRMLQLRRAIWPLREAFNTLIRDEDCPLIARETRAYFRDVYDHTVQLIDLLETYRELSSNLMDVYLSSLSNRLNEVMKVLTIITTIFIPLTFICGVYGMNFNPDKSPLNMPELNWYWGYPVAMMVMLLIAVGELIYFQRRGWLGK